MSTVVTSPLRVGTRSCSECRRRKVRCTWTSEQARVCRRCEERESTCVPQVKTKDAKERRKLSSKERIARLEAQLGQLNGTVSSLQSRAQLPLGLSPPTSNPASEFRSLSVHDTLEDDEDSRSSSDSDFIAEDRPLHLYSLFENDVLSTNTDRNARAKYERSSRSFTVTHNTTRAVLQRLIPARSDIRAVSEGLVYWQHLVCEILPLVSPPKAATELLSVYDAMEQPDVDIINLATWLLNVALGTQPAPPDNSSPDSLMRHVRNKSGYIQTLSDAVEKHVLSNDKLMGTVRGVSLALLHSRAQFVNQPMHKAWLSVRRLTAFAELIGLPRAARLAGMYNGSDHSPVQDSTLGMKAALWTSICSVNKVFCVILNFPCAILPHSSLNSPNLVIDGMVSAREYISRLSEIAIKVQDIDDLSMEKGVEADLYASILRCDTDLRLLSSQVPPQWWSIPTDTIHSAHLLQFIHNCVAMRVNLSCTLRQDPQGHFRYVRQAGLHACYEVVRRWLILRKALPVGFFISRGLDTQALTATIALLLASKQAQTGNDDYPAGVEFVPRVIDLMEEKSRDPVGSDVATQGVTVIRALVDMLERSDGEASGDLKLSIPRLGKVHVWHNSPVADVHAATALAMASNHVPTIQAWQDPHNPLVQQSTSDGIVMDFSRMESAILPDGPVSWFFENDWSVFDDVFMDGTFDFPQVS